MLCALYTLKKEYWKKKLYIWNINRDSMDVFTNVVFRKIDISGFVSLEEQYVGNTYMNRPIVSLNQIEHEDYLVLAADEVPKEKIRMLDDNKVIYWSDALDLNADLMEKKIIVYGIGNGAKQLCETLGKKNLQAEMYCVTSKAHDMDQYEGKAIIEASELEDQKDCAVIVSVIRMNHCWEILKTLREFSGQVYVDLSRMIAHKSEINFVQSIDYAVRHNRKIYLYTDRSVIADMLEEALQIYNIRIDGYVFDREDKTGNIKNVYELALDGVEDKLVIINVINEEPCEHLIEARNNLECAGFSVENFSYVGFTHYTTADERLRGILPFSYDALVGNSVFYPDGKAGWQIYGEEEEDRIRIMVLGGSTSSEEYFVENWSRRLYYKLKQAGVNVTIYNGAIPGDDIVDEMLRLLRDGYYLQPHLVISMSGVNNLHYKDCANQFNEERVLDWVKRLTSGSRYCTGVCGDETLYDFWSRNIRLLGMISEFYGARFFGFLQPMNITMDSMSVWEKSLYEQEETMTGAMEFAKSVTNRKGEEYIDLMRLFEHQDNMYLDVCHYTNKAHEILAEIVYETIMPELNQHN